MSLVIGLMKNMNKKSKSKAFDIFYNKYKMLEKFNYIKSVMFSCTTTQQLDVTHKWGESTLWKWFDTMNNDDDFDLFGIWSFCYSRTCDLSDDLKNTYKELSDKLTKVVV